MQLYGNQIWNDVVDNANKAYFVMQQDVFSLVTDKLEEHGINYFAYEQSGICKMAVNQHDLRYFRDVIGDKLLEQMDRVEAVRSNQPQSIIGTVSYAEIPQKRYLATDIDHALKIAERLKSMEIPFSGRVYEDHATLTVAEQYEDTLRTLNNELLSERQQHRHAVSQYMVVGNVSLHQLHNQRHFLSKMSPQEFLARNSELMKAGIPYSGCVKNGGVVLTVSQEDAERFERLLNYTEAYREGIHELEDAGFTAHQIALLSDAIDAFAQTDNWLGLQGLVDPRLSDEQLRYIAEKGIAYIRQEEIDRFMDRNGLLSDMIQYRQAAVKRIEFNEAVTDSAFNEYQLEALFALHEQGITLDTLLSVIDETYSAEEIEQFGECFRNCDLVGIQKIQDAHNGIPDPVIEMVDPIPDDAAITVAMHDAEAEMQRDVPAEAIHPLITETTVEDPQPQGDTFQILRLPYTDETRNLRFEGYLYLTSHGYDVTASNYDVVYTGQMDRQNSTLDGIYYTFNTNHPDDYIGYSLSVGDIIVLNKDGVTSAHMVESIGFLELPDFFIDRTAERESQQADQQVDLFDLAYSDQAKGVIGNTPFRFISGKTYHKLDTEIAEAVAYELNAQGIKFSGKIKGNQTTLTIPAANEEQFQQISAPIIAEYRMHHEEIEEQQESDVQPATQETPTTEDMETEAADQEAKPFELHIGDHIRTADDNSRWCVIGVDDFMLRLENLDKSSLTSARALTGWKKHLNAENCEILPEKGLPDPPKPKKRQSKAAKQAEGQLGLFGEPEESVTEARRAELLHNDLMRGSGFENGKFRIIEFYMEYHPQTSQFADFLKHEYGIGGYSGPGMPRVSHDGKGIEISLWETGEKHNYTWSEVAKEIAALIEKGQYITAEDLQDAIDSAHYYIDNYPNDTAHMRISQAFLDKYENIDPSQLASSLKAVTAQPQTPIAESQPSVTPMPMQPMYHHDFGYAREHGEEALYRANIEATRACEDALEQAITKHYQNNILNTDAVLADLQAEFTIDRIAFVLAAAVTNAEWDGRYSGDVRDWANKELLHSNPYLVGTVSLKSHPGLLNLVADHVREQQAELALEEPALHEQYQMISQSFHDYLETRGEATRFSRITSEQQARLQQQYWSETTAEDALEWREKLMPLQQEYVAAFDEFVAIGLDVLGDEFAASVKAAKEAAEAPFEAVAINYWGESKAADQSQHLVNAPFASFATPKIPVAESETANIIRSVWRSYSKPTEQMHESISEEEMDAESLAIRQQQVDSLIQDVQKRIEKFDPETQEPAKLQELQNTLEYLRSDDIAHIELTQEAIDTFVSEKSQSTVAKPQTAAPKERIPNTLEHQIFKRMQKLYPDIMKESPTAHTYERHEHPDEDTGYEPLSMERITSIRDHQCQLAIMHTYEQNGDLMRDPEIVLRVDFAKQTATAISYQQDGLGIYREYADQTVGQRDTNRFMIDWLKNLEQQPREITRAVAEFAHDGRIDDVTINYQNGVVSRVSAETPEIEAAYMQAAGIHLQDEPDAVPTEIEQQPDTASATFIITDSELGFGGAKTKFQRNVEAIRVLNQLESEDRLPTHEEQVTLSQYVGWGGLPEAFDSTIDSWSKEYTALRELLTEDEYIAARASTENAHFTQPIIVEQMYRALEQFGFEGGRILEPAMGIGNFFGAMPSELRSRSELFGVELDSISGRIAQKLYPDADISVSGFEQTHFNNDAFDVVIGNVPFGDYRVLDHEYDALKFRIHDYFLAKSLDKLKPGGIMACITSSGTLDKKDETVRSYLAEKAELVGAIRLPGGTHGAFKANAGTEVTADILFFRKREEPLSADAPLPEWVHRSTTADDLQVNSFFVEHPEMVLGTLQASNNPFSSGVECVGDPSADLKTQLSQAIRQISTTIQAEPSRIPAKQELVMGDAPVRTYFMRDNDIYYRSSATKPAEVPPAANKGTKKKRIEGMIGIRDAVRDVIHAQLNGAADDGVQKLQAALQERYDAFYRSFGLIHSKSNAQAFREDDGYALICSLEKKFDLQKDQLLEKADIFTKRTIRPITEVEYVGTSQEALIVSLQQRGGIDFPWMEQLCGKSKAEMISELDGEIYPVPDLKNPDHITYQTADAYLSGNVRLKLRDAIEAAKHNPIFEKNVKALEAALPERLRSGDITVRLGATWIDPKYIRDFMYEVLDTPRYLRASDDPWRRSASRIDVQYVPEAGIWNITNHKLDHSIKVTRDYGTKDCSAYEILKDLLNLRTPKVYKTVEDPGSETGEKRVIDGEATALAQKKAAALQAAFADWIFRDPERAADLVERYNELFNGIRPRTFDGSHLVFHGMNSDVELRPHQKNAIARALFGGNALFAHCVGAGKTYEMIATAMEGKRLGLHHKSMFVVPKHLTEQIGQDFLKLYPNANVLVATAKDFQKANRRELMARIATGNYDAVIVSHDQFKLLPLSPEVATKAMRKEVEAITQSIDRERMASGAKSFTVKALERQKRTLEQNIQRIVEAAKKDEQNVTFEQLGIDKLFVDEAHEFKNLFCPTKLQNLTGISTSASQKAMDMYLKCRYLDEVTGSRGVVFATGTPISNSITEMHTMMRYLAHDLLEQCGTEAFDAWISTFGAPKTDWELSTTGTKWRQKTRMAGFDNLPELLTHFRCFADVQTAEMLKLPVPECEMHIVEAEPTQLQQEMVQELSDRADAVQAGNVNSHDDNLLKITGDGRKVGLDPRLVDPTLPDDPSTKLNLCVDNVFRIWEETAEQRSTQLIFCDLGVPHKTAAQDELVAAEESDTSIAELFSLEEELPFCVYDDIKQKLMDRGVPESEIAFIHSAKTETQKSALFEKVRSGEVRVLLGSTPKMGTGTNVQDRLIALHDLDIPWRPADLEQRRGRMVRFGNVNDQVHLYRYVTKGTFDAVSYQTLEAKQKFISQAMSSSCATRSCEDIDQSALTYAQIKVSCTGDTRFREQMQLQADVQTLTLQKKEHMNTQDEMHEKVRMLPQQIEQAEVKLEQIQLDYSHLASMPRDDQGLLFAIEINGETITDKTEAAKAVAKFYPIAEKNPGQEIMIGNFCGFPLSITCQMNHMYANLHGARMYSNELSTATNYIVRGLQETVNQVGKQLHGTKNAIATMKVELQHAQERAGQPFPMEEELKEKSARLDTLSEALRREAMAKTAEGKAEGRTTFYFDKAKRSQARETAAKATTPTTIGVSTDQQALD